jgi:hypothetical protein
MIDATVQVLTAWSATGVTDPTETRSLLLRWESVNLLTVEQSPENGTKTPEESGRHEERGIEW